MSAAAYRAPRRAPPHDPLSLRLSGADGWRPGILTDVTAPPPGDALTLALIAPAGPGLLDPLGMLGGLVAPPFVGLAPDGALYLLDGVSRRLLWFDACACRFVPLPCLGNPGPADPRALSKPVAIAVGASVLALADGLDGGAVVVLSRRDLAVRTVLRRDWLPGPLAIDRHDRLYVTDLKAGAVHRFAVDGRWLGAIPGAGLVYGLAIDREDRLYVASADAVRRFTAAAVAIDQPTDRNAIATSFPPLPFTVDAVGRLVLAALCRAAGSTVVGSGVFDGAGTALTVAPAPWPAASYATAGRFVSTALDSHIASCVWHRIALRADLPAHTTLTVRARTDEIDQPVDLIAPPGDAAWSAPQVWRGPLQAEIECLYTTPPGRFLWLELALEGHGGETPRVASAAIQFPRIPLRRYLPAAFVPDPITGDFSDRLLAVFDQNFRSIERRIDDEAALFDPRSTPLAMLSWLAGWVGLALPGGLSPAEQRHLVRELPRLYARRGTVEGLRALLILYLGLDGAACCPRPCPWGPACPAPPVLAALPKLVLEHWRLRRWLFLGQGRLGEASRLWGESILNRSRLDQGMQLGVTQIKLERDPIRDPFHAEAHIFSVFLPAGRARKPSARQRIEALIRREAPAHTQPMVHWVEPNMRLGTQSTLGFDTVIGMPPTPQIVLDSARLGRATVLGAALPPEPGLTIGRSSSLGLGTRLG